MKIKLQYFMFFFFLPTFYKPKYLQSDKNNKYRIE